MYRGALLYQWLIERIRVIAARIGLYGSMCALCITLLGVAILFVVSLIPLYLNQHGEEALGELYCINNYTLRAAFQIPQYNTTFTDTMTSSMNYAFTTFGQNVSPGRPFCGGPVNITTSESVATSDTCNFVIFSNISPKSPNAKVYDNYALSEACYRTLQSCHYDPLLTSCLLSNCTASGTVTASVTAVTLLTNYTLLCTTNIYYKTRCVDDGASDRLYYSSSQRNSACRQQRLNRINQCLNSTVQLANVPCLISVSSGVTTSATAGCAQTISDAVLNINFFETTGLTTFSTQFGMSVNPNPGRLLSSFSNQGFSASDQVDGHVYRISSVNSQNYASSQSGALYCGAVTRTQIASSINTAISSQT